MVLDEVEDLERRGYLPIVHGASASLGSNMMLTGTGRQLHELLDLESIDQRGLEEPDRLLHGKFRASSEDG